MEFVTAKTISHFEEIEKLASEIIPEFYQHIHPDDHNIFFVKMFCSVKAIREQIQKGYEFFLFNISGKNIGYMAITFSKDTLHLSKLYILKQYQGKGIGDKTILLVNEKQKKRMYVILN